MKLDDTLRALEELAQKKSIKVAYEPLGGELGAGGLCKVKGEWRILVDKRATPNERVAIVAEGLSRFPLDDVFVAPEIRQLIERMKKPLRRAAEPESPRDTPELGRNMDANPFARKSPKPGPNSGPDSDPNTNLNLDLKTDPDSDPPPRR